ncbi:MAG: HD domain-containing protein, partial [Sediminibacterium sp.]
CTRLLNRKLYKSRIQSEPFDPDFVTAKSLEVIQKFGINEADSHYFCFTGEATNTAYHNKEEKINILFKDGSIKDITEISNAMIQQNLSSTVKKFYICLLT